jgi:hypothetical protein
MTIQEALQIVISKNVPEEYAPFVASQLFSVADQLLTPEAITAAITELVNAIMQSDIATAYGLMVSMKSTNELVADADAAISELEAMNEKQVKDEAAMNTWLINLLTGIALIALSIVKTV